MRTSMLAAVRRLVNAGAVTLYRDDFATDGAISAGARTADPGPGTATIADSTAVWSSISSGILLPSKSFAVLLEPDYQTEAFEYASGRAFITRLAVDNRGGSTAENWIYAGWFDDGGAPLYEAAGFRFVQNSYWGFQQGLYAYDQGLQVAANVSDYPAALEYQKIAVVMTDAEPADPYYLTPEGGSTPGSFYYFLNGKLRHFTSWGVWSTWSKSNMRGRVTHSFSGIAPRSAARVDYVRVRDLGAPFSDGSFATIMQRPPAWNTPYTGSADGICQFVFTSVAVPTTDPVLKFRIQDANNYWKVYFSISENCYCLDSVAAGVATRRITGGDATASSMWYPDGFQNGFRVMTEGTTIFLYSYCYGYIYTEGKVTLDHRTSATGVQIEQSGSDYTPVDLVCYPLSSAAYDVFDEV